MAKLRRVGAGPLRVAGGVVRIRFGQGFGQRESRGDPGGIHPDVGVESSRPRAAACPRPPSVRTNSGMSSSSTGIPASRPSPLLTSSTESSASARSSALSWKSWGLEPSGTSCSTSASGPATCAVMSARMPVVAVTFGALRPRSRAVRSAGEQADRARGWRPGRGAIVFKGSDHAAAQMGVVSERWRRRHRLRAAHGLRHTFPVTPPARTRHPLGDVGPLPRAGDDRPRGHGKAFIDAKRDQREGR